jgi:hypothetical protein
MTADLIGGEICSSRTVESGTSDTKRKAGSGDVFRESEEDHAR